MEMDRKVALVTGSSRGIGAATVLEFAKKGYDVVINYLSNEEKAEALKRKVEEEYHRKVLVVKADVSNEESVKNMVEKTILEFGHIDCLVNNAGIAIDNEMTDKSKEEFLKVIETNLIGTFLVSKYVGKYMLEKKQGVIINISSNNGIDQNYPLAMDYDASKSGVISLTKNLAVQYAPYIRVNSVAPGWTNTEPVLEMNPDFIEEEKHKILLARFADPEEIAKVVVFLASDDASYINSEVIRVDGGCR